MSVDAKKPDGFDKFDILMRKLAKVPQGRQQANHCKLCNAPFIGINGRYISFIRGGGAVAVTIPQPIVGFRGWRYRWWERSVETPLDLSEFIHDAMK